MVTGVPGIGKRAFRDWLSYRFLCLEPEDLDACGRCTACRQHRADSSSDRRNLVPEEAGRLIKIDAIRDLVAWLQLTAERDSYRLAVIDPAERMNRNAANSLLKTLEEPAERVLILLISDAPSRLPATVRSRCQTVTLRSSDPVAARHWLAGRLEERQEADNVSGGAAGDKAGAEAKGVGASAGGPAGVNARMTAEADSHSPMRDAAFWLARARGAPFLALRLASAEAEATRRTVFKAWEALLLHRASIGRIVESVSRQGTAEVLELCLELCSQSLRALSGLPPGPDPALNSTVSVTAERLTAEQWFTVRDRIAYLYRIDSASFRTNTVLEGLFADIRIRIQA